MYVMAMYPGDTPDGWRRQLFSDLAHGVKHINIWPLQTVDSSSNGCYLDPTPAGNHSFAAMYKEIRRGFLDIGHFDDIIRLGRQAKPSKVALLFAESSDYWLPQSVNRAFDDNTQGYRYGTFGSARQALFLALLHTGIELDLVLEEDTVGVAPALDQYSVLFVADPNLAKGAATGIEKWVRRGGTVFATAGGGAWDEFNRTSTAFAELLGSRTVQLEHGSRGRNATIDFLKQDLAFAEKLDTVNLDGHPMGVFGHRGLLGTLAPGTDVLARFEAAKTPALTRRKVGKGLAINCAMHPGLAYMHPALPKRPVDRGTDESAYNHFVPHEFNTAARDVLLAKTSALSNVTQASSASNPLVDVQLIVAHRRNASVAVLTNWAGRSLTNVTVVVDTTLVPEWTTAALATGNKVSESHLVNGGGVGGVSLSHFTIESLEVADALILRDSTM
eukprot:SAG22_NODE_149_length_17456_cov_5.058363_3_plen_445_part_00